MVERRGRRGEYGREIGRRAQFQAGLFETLLVTLSIPWVNGQSIGANSVLGLGERGLLLVPPPSPLPPFLRPRALTCSTIRTSFFPMDLAILLWTCHSVVLL